MTHRVPKSRAPDAVIFAQSVRAHASDLTAWSKHVDLVRRGEAQYYPPPQAPSPDVAAAVRVDGRDEGRVVEFTSDYEIFDDGPSPEDVLRRKKNDLLAKVGAAESAAMHAVLPPGKHRLHGRRRDEILARSEEDRSEEDAVFVAHHEDVLGQMRRIADAATDMMSEIEDLTLSDIDQWVMQPLS